MPLITGGGGVINQEFKLGAWHLLAGGLQEMQLSLDFGCLEVQADAECWVRLGFCNFGLPGAFGCARG